MGKILKETRGDVQEAIDTAYYMAGEGRRMFGPTTPSELPNKFAMAVRTPIGVCAMITPWNFPMAIPSWKLLPAIVCGNTCVIKPAQDTPLSTFNLVRTLADAGVPKGVINIVTGFGSSVGTPMTEHPEVRAVSLTGSTEVGRIVGTTAAKTFKHCSLELGGKNPMIVLDDANLDLAIEGGLWADSAPPASAALLPAASSYRKESTASSSSAMSIVPRHSKLATVWMKLSTWAQRSMPASLAPISITSKWAAPKAPS